MKQDQKYSFGRLLLNQSGQAAIEYVLLIVVIVSLIFGVKKAFNNVDDFISHYIGDYVTCLMEYGELPSLGVVAADQKKHLGGTGKKCDEDFAGFTFEGGVPAAGGSSGSSSGSSSSSASGNKNNSSVAGSKNSSSSAAKGGSGGKSGSGSNSDANSAFGSGGRTGSKSGRDNSPYAKGEIMRSGAKYTADGNESSSQKVRVLEEDPEVIRKRRDSDYAFSRGNRGRYGNDKYRAITGVMQAEIEKKIPRKPRAPSSNVVGLIGDEGNRFGPYKKTFTPPAPKNIQLREDDNSGFSFGYFMRWLIIAAMILAIIVFFGGQIMNYSNSKD